MGYYWDKDRGYIYVASDYDMNIHTHGGHEEEHKKEMEQIANDIFDKKIEQIIPEVAQSAYAQAIIDLKRALMCDVSTEVSVAFDQGAQIFYDKKTQTIIKNAIYNEIVKLLNDKQKSP